MDVLNQAKDAIDWADGEKPDLDDYFFRKAQAYAAIAQAEQLKRIADALDIMAHPKRIVAPDPQDYFSEDEYNTAAANYDYNKNSKPGESMAEYRTRTSGPDW
jgi:hypothetical protein